MSERCPKCGRDMESHGAGSDHGEHSIDGETCLTHQLAQAKQALAEEQSCTKQREVAMSVELQRLRGGTCNACGEPLLPANAWMEDGCPCNGEKGCNDTLKLLDLACERGQHWGDKVAGLLEQLAAAVARAEKAEAACAENLQKELLDELKRLRKHYVDCPLAKGHHKVEDLYAAEEAMDREAAGQ